MSFLDYAIFAVYMLIILGVGYYFFRKNTTTEDYYVGGRKISSAHIGLSIAATDVGGGFSIGLGGLGYAIGLSGSWLLFTGLVGAWLSAVFIIPHLKHLDLQYGFMTYPDFLRHRYGKSVALTAAVISGIGYLGFTSGQILAGAKLMSGSVLPVAPMGMDPLTFAIFIIGFIIVGYTVLGGLKAVIYTDTVQWIILFCGLIFAAIPFALNAAGGLSGLRAALPDAHLTLSNISPITFINWFLTIVPIWLVAMTLYQRVFASPSVKSAQRAWYIAGIFEYPLMAFTGVFLGVLARVLIPNVEAEMGVPILLREVLPIGLTGIVVASYFSAIMSTADSCIIAASGNFVNDLIERLIKRPLETKQSIRLSQIVTLIVGVLAIILASSLTTVLDAILYAYQFMVAGLFIPTLAAYFWPRATSLAALSAMIGGGTTTLVLIGLGAALPFGLDPTFFGMLISLVLLISVSLIKPNQPGVKI
ncbi:MAG: sodium:solute symporter family protein [Candidatus Marinimicrobia bacterium]|nr:sodium:solute symporter family protein [Candidatus Neomarinimicrobiota bacterium]MCF7851102.1 sodium:solute symporter family protein [Candidatus Neomarinimicrobiota bacterium]MCF7904350.1 sodium:solute symporter family protein [Candidatus Neomarinimicrobiota bacterium]